MVARSLPMFVCAALLANCSSQTHHDEPPTHSRGHASGSAFASRARTAFVSTEPAAPASRSVSHTLFAHVAFDERHFATMGPPVQGRVAAVNFVEGDHVNRGDVLLTIHSADIAAAQAQVAEARTARILAEQTATRTADLVREGAASEAERLETAAAAQQARDEERRAIAAIAAIGGGSGSSDYALRAPFSGTVIERRVAVGNEVHTGQDTLFRIADLSRVWVIADVFEQDLPLLHTNDEADVTLVAQPGRTFSGRITYVGDVVDPQTRAVHTRIELPNADNALRPGMFAQVTLHSAVAGAADVPTSAVLARRDQFFVFVQSPEGSFLPREVRIGEQHAHHTTILDGLHPGELVVTGGAILLDSEANEAL